MSLWRNRNTRPALFVGVAELVDALGLGPSGEIHESSNLSSDTSKKCGVPKRVQVQILPGTHFTFFCLF